MSSAGIPVVFSAPRSIRLLNVVAVAASIAACTGAIGTLAAGSWSWAIVTGLPTLLIAWIWALCLRWQKESAGGKRWGWFLSVPLAAVNAALACGTMFLVEDGSPLAFAGGALLGATFGAIVWVPAMALVLTLFGMPIAHAQRLARRGLAGEERGERIVGLVAALLAAVALAIAWVSPRQATYVTEWNTLNPVGAVLLHVMALAGIACGTIAAVRAAERERRRRRFVARVEALEEPGYRVEPTQAGKVLVRVAPVASYRVSDRAEELFELDEAGRAISAVR